MKKIGKALIGLIAGVWFITALFVTICLLSYNEFKVSTFGKTSLLVIDSDELEPLFKEGDLLFIKRNSDSKINIGDPVFYYNSKMNSSTLVYYDKVEAKEEISKSQTTYTLDGELVSSDYIIGKADGIAVWHHMGKILNIMTSKWGFMFLIIFPTLFAMIYEITMIVDTYRRSDEE